MQDFQKSTMLDNASNRVDKYEFLLSIKELASKGMTAEVVDEINALDPDFFTQNPTLLFQLKQVLISKSYSVQQLKVFIEGRCKKPKFTYAG